MSLLFKLLAITASAMFAGVMLAIGVILGGYWRSLPPQDFLDWFAQYDQLIVRAITIVAVPTLIGLIGALWFDWSRSAQRIIWLGAVGCLVVVFALTMIYFLPSNAEFVAKAVPVDQVSSKIDTWLMIHNVRILLAVAASALGVWAISRRTGTAAR